MDLTQIRNPKCRLCPLYEEVKTVCLMGEGNPNADILFVGDAPGQDEDRAGHPFVGATGQILSNILREYEIKRSDVYISNAVKCRPPNNRRPHVSEIKACRHYLLREIRFIKPKIIVALGQVAMATLLNTQTFVIHSGRGRVHYAPWKATKGIPIIVTYHPAAVKRDQTLIESVFVDFEYFLGILKNGIKERSTCKYFSGIDPDITKYTAFDLETTGFNPFISSSKILCAGTSVRSHRGYCTTDLQLLVDKIADPNILKIGHNIKFDIKWWKTQGYEFNGQIHDTLVAEHLCNENHPSYGLKELASVYTDMGAYSAEIEILRKQGKEIPIRKLMKYCAEDVDATMRLYKRQIPMLEEEGLMPLFDMVMEGEVVMADAEIHGLNVDKERHEYLSRNFRKKIIKYKEEIKEICGEDLNNPDSSVQLGKVLVGKLGFPVLKRTKKGKVSVDKETLDKLARLDKTGIIELILNYRKLRGDYSKYLSPKKIIWQEDGRVHADFRINGTDTGRYSCALPNIQQVPRESQIKSMFISVFEHGKIIQADYDQGELRLLAHVANEKSLIRAFNEGIDVHTLTASEVYKIAMDSVSEKQRYDAKQLNFSILYGMGAPAFARKTKMKLKDAEIFIERYMKSKPGIRQYKQDMANQIEEQGYVVNLFGRRRRIPIMDLENREEVGHAHRKAINAPIQSALHDLNVLSMTRLYRKLRSLDYKSQIIGAIHDSVLIDAHPKEAKNLPDIIKKIFTNPSTSAFGFELNVPMTVSIGIGDNWKEASGK